MNSKQIVGVAGAILVIVGCFMPFVNIPLIGGISYAFPPGKSMGDGVIVAALALLGLLGALRGGSLLLLLGSVLGGLVFGYSLYNISGALNKSREAGGLEGAFMSASGLGVGVAAIGIGLLLMFVSSAMKVTQTQANAPAAQ